LDQAGRRRARPDADDLLADFALDIRVRGFRVAGSVQLNNRRVGVPGGGCADEIELFDLSTGENPDTPA
jgi:hypothetical protein